MPDVPIRGNVEATFNSAMIERVGNRLEALLGDVAGKGNGGSVTIIQNNNFNNHQQAPSNQPTMDSTLAAALQSAADRFQGALDTIDRLTGGQFKGTRDYETYAKQIDNQGRLISKYFDANSQQSKSQTQIEALVSAVRQWQNGTFASSLGSQMKDMLSSGRLNGIGQSRHMKDLADSIVAGGRNAQQMTSVSDFVREAGALFGAFSRFKSKFSSEMKSQYGLSWDEYKAERQRRRDAAREKRQKYNEDRQQQAAEAERQRREAEAEKQRQETETKRQADEAKRQKQEAEADRRRRDTEQETARDIAKKQPSAPERTRERQEARREHVQEQREEQTSSQKRKETKVEADRVTVESDKAPEVNGGGDSASSGKKGKAGGANNAVEDALRNMERQGSAVGGAGGNGKPPKTPDAAGGAPSGGGAPLGDNGQAGDIDSRRAERIMSDVKAVAHNFGKLGIDLTNPDARTRDMSDAGRVGQLYRDYLQAEQNFMDSQGRIGNRTALLNQMADLRGQLNDALKVERAAASRESMDTRRAERKADIQNAAQASLDARNADKVSQRKAVTDALDRLDQAQTPLETEKAIHDVRSAKKELDRATREYNAAEAQASRDSKRAETEADREARRDIRIQNRKDAAEQALQANEGRNPVKSKALTDALTALGNAQTPAALTKALDDVDKKTRDLTERTKAYADAQSRTAKESVAAEKAQVRQAARVENAQVKAERDSQYGNIAAGARDYMSEMAAVYKQTGSARDLARYQTAVGNVRWAEQLAQAKDYKQMLDTMKNPTGEPGRDDSSRWSQAELTQAEALLKTYTQIQSLRNSGRSQTQADTLLGNMRSQMADLQTMATAREQMQASYQKAMTGKNISRVDQTLTNNLNQAMSAMLSAAPDQFAAKMNAVQEALKAVNTSMQAIGAQDYWAQQSAALDQYQAKLNSMNQRNGGMDSWTESQRSTSAVIQQDLDAARAAMSAKDMGAYQAAMGRVQGNSRLLDTSLINISRLAGGAKPPVDALTRSLMNIAAPMMLWRRFTGYMKKAAQNVAAIDSQMADLKKVTSNTSAEYDQFLTSTGKNAVAIGSSISDLVATTSTFAHMGYGLTESQALGVTATKFANVGGFKNTTDAADTMIAAIKGFSDLEIGDADIVGDKLTAVANNYAVTVEDISNGLQKSASALNVAGNNIDQSTAMITAIAEVTRDAGAAGSALKVLSMRIRGAKAE